MSKKYTLERHTKELRVRLTPSELDRIAAHVASEGLPLTVWARFALLHAVTHKLSTVASEGIPGAPSTPHLPHGPVLPLGATLDPKGQTYVLKGTHYDAATGEPISASNMSLLTLGIRPKKGQMKK